jgi:hypothetical protein
MKTSFNKFIYIGFILFGIYELVYKHSAGDAATYMGIALAFNFSIKHNHGKKDQHGKKQF